MAKEYKDLVVGLDIGTAKVMVVVAEVLPGGELKLAGLGIAPSNGLKRGVVVNIDATVQSIQQALKEAELMAYCKITRVYTGITGSHIRGINSSGMVAVKDKEVTAADVARVLETAKAINISTDQRLLLVEPQEFIIDSQDVKEPIGMSGIRLEAKVHIVTGAQSAAENIIKCVRRCGLEVEQLMLNPLASSLSVLTEDERELGVSLVDAAADCQPADFYCTPQQPCGSEPLGSGTTVPIASAAANPRYGVQVWSVSAQGAWTLLAPCPGCNQSPPNAATMVRTTVLLPKRDPLPSAPRRFWVVPVAYELVGLRPGGVPPYEDRDLDMTRTAKALKITYGLYMM